MREISEKTVSVLCQPPVDDWEISGNLKMPYTLLDLTSKTTVWDYLVSKHYTFWDGKDIWPVLRVNGTNAHWRMLLNCISFSKCYLKIKYVSASL